MKFVVTGASGPIGIAFVQLLVHNGHQVFILSSGKSPKPIIFEHSSISIFMRPFFL